MQEWDHQRHIASWLDKREVSIAPGPKDLHNSVVTVVMAVSAKSYPTSAQMTSPEFACSGPSSPFSHVQTCAIALSPHKVRPEHAQKPYDGILCGPMHVHR